MNASRLYKITSAGGRPLHGGTGRWPLPGNESPGRWRRVKGPLEPCSRGLHLLRLDDLSWWAALGVLWEAQVEPGAVVIKADRKIVVSGARLLRQAAMLDARVLVAWAADCAEHVLGLFEDAVPGDRRPREAIEAARAVWTAGDAAEAAERHWQSERLAELLGLAP